MTKAVSIQCRRFVVHGKVQGVFFRASARDVARRLRITGHAINLPDGSVEVLARGDAEALQSMHQWLLQGPAMARVESVHVESVNEERADTMATDSFTTA